jgi:glutamine synthetase
MMAAVDTYADLLRLSVASASNDCRLGGHEAPPAIVSMFLGDEINHILESLVANKKYVKKHSSQIEHGIKFMPNLISDSSDRNRTSPFAFTGSKFEFRMPGSSLNIACVNMILNTAVADAINNAITLLGTNPTEQKIKQVIKLLYAKHKRILFSGNGYSKE